MCVRRIPAAEMTVIYFLFSFHFLSWNLQFLYNSGSIPSIWLLHFPYFTYSVFFSSGTEMREEGIPFYLEDISLVGIQYTYDREDVFN
jgi:hypothetical protein